MRVTAWIATRMATSLSKRDRAIHIGQTDAVVIGGFMRSGRHAQVRDQIGLVVGAGDQPIQRVIAAQFNIISDMQRYGVPSCELALKNPASPALASIPSAAV